MTSRHPNPATPKTVLAEALRELGIATSAEVTFASFPRLEEAAAGLAWHLTGHILYPMAPPRVSTLPLLHLCLKDAFEWMAYCMTRPEPDVRKVQTAFLAGLLRHAPELVHVEMVEGDVVWDPLNDEPMSEWLHMHPNTRFTMRETTLSDLSMSDRDIRMALLTRVFSTSGVASLDASITQILQPPDELHPSREFYGQ